MSLKSLSAKLYLGIGVVAVVLWVFGVPGRTILSFALVASMVAMHAGGHGHSGGHGHGGNNGQDARAVGGAPADHEAHTPIGVRNETDGGLSARRPQPPSTKPGCH